jgi:hypothetical protein
MFRNIVARFRIPARRMMSTTAADGGHGGPVYSRVFVENFLPRFGANLSVFGAWPCPFIYLPLVSPRLTQYYIGLAYYSYHRSQSQRDKARDAVLRKR